MDKFVKINSTQGGPFTPTQNLIDFVIPSSMGVVDLKDSYINLVTRMTTTEVDTTGGEGVYPVELRWDADGGGNRYKFTNSALVKNCNLRSEQRGQIENVRRVDQLRQNLSLYTRSQREDFCESYLSASGLINPVNRNNFQLFQEMNKTGSVKSRQLESTPVQISLEDLFGFCQSAPEVDLSKLGTLRVHCEMNLGKVTTGIPMTNPATDWANEDLKEVEDVTTQGSPTSVQTKQKYTDLDLSPFWVGQALKLNATGAGGASNITDKRVVIQSIEWQKSAGGHFVITFTESWGTIGAGESYTGITIVPYDSVTGEISFDFAELVVKRVGRPVGVDEIRYDVFSTEETNGNALTSFQNQYQVEPDAKNVFICFPDDDTDLFSFNNDITSFRLRLNNQDLTDRDIVTNPTRSPLYYDRINMSLGNMGEPTKNLIEHPAVLSSTWTDVYVGDKIVTAMNPLFLTEREKYLQLNVNATGAGVKKITIFKQLPRSIEL